ncbi:MAG: lamin tail domain-containing protein [Chitinophagales bacterium]|nr:lamin tail domain-containing protein [Chitinophagales bacterium]
MNIKHYSILSLLCFAGFSLSAQVLINEYSASNLLSFTDSFLRTEDWIELYNTSNAPVDISGWHLSDKEDKPEKWEIPAGTIIPANGFLVFLCSGRDGFMNNEYHTNFKLAQTEADEVVLLSDIDGEVIEIYSLQLTLVEHSRCRAQDGGSDWVVCTQPSFGTSNNSTPQYAGYTQAPDIELAAGFYNGSQTVSVINNEPNSVLRYTLDGTNPTSNSPEYTTPLVVNNTTVVKAQAFSNDPNILTGKMDFHTFFIDEDFSLAVFSVAADQVIDLANGAGAVIPIGSLEYFDTNKELQATAFGSLNRHGQDSWVLPHRSLDWVSRDEMGYAKAVNAPLFGYSDRDEYQKFMFRNSGDDNYPAINDAAHEGSTHIRDEYVQTLAMNGGMELDQRAVERVVLFLNGQYWGVYGMRERPVDHDYTGEYYNQGKYEIQYLTTWDYTTIEYGGVQAQQDWENLRDFILHNDMSNPDNYKIADDSLNMLSLIDYMIVNLTVVASDWLNYNTGWWRGLNPDGKHKKWGYILWDLDATFDYYINYSGVPNTSPNAQPCDLEDIAEFMDDFFWGMDVGQHEKIFLKLLDENPTFKQLYYSRYADMMNTTYSCDNMITTLDSMLAVIEPEMPRQINRWGGSLGEWQANVQELKNFIEERCMLIDDGMLDCYEELDGPYQLTLLTEPSGIGEIDLNTLDIETFPWTGDYFGGMENLIKAKVFNDYEDQYQFSHWESKAGNDILPNLITRKATITLSQADTLTAVFKLREGTIDEQDVTINEIIASNDSTSTIADPAGEYEDWIELYNNTDEEINLSGTFLSDDPDDLTQWQFPSGTTIAPNAYLIIWADKDDDQEGLHASFKLSKDGENLILSDVDTTLIDQVIFGEQTTNIAYARIPNGTGDFVNQAATFNANNENVTSVQNLNKDIQIKVYPNPARNYFTVEYTLDKAADVNISLQSIIGQKVVQFPDAGGRKNSGKHKINLSVGQLQLPTGMYMLMLNTDTGIGTKKLMIID